MIYFSRARVQKVIESSSLVDECMIEEQTGQIKFIVKMNENYVAHVLLNDSKILLPFQLEVNEMLPFGIRISYEFI